MLKTLAAASLVLIAATGLADPSYPSKPITLVVAYPAGGSTDTVARKWGEELSKKLRQPVLIENVGGAGGMIGARRVAKASADGYTLLLGSVNEIVLSPLSQKSSQYKPSDFRAIMITGVSPVVLLANRSRQYKSVADVVAAGKRKQQIPYGTPGRGTFQHVVMHALEAKLKTDLLHIPYKGGAAFITDAIAGQIDLILLPAVTALPLISGGQLTGLAVSSATKADVFPTIPTMAESTPELQGFDFTIWAGLFAPSGTPHAVIDKLNTAMREVHQAESIQTFLKATGAWIPSPALDLWGAQRFVEAEDRKYKSIVPMMKLED